MTSGREAENAMLRNIAQRMPGIGSSAWLLLACSLPLFALIIGLAVDHFERQRGALFAELEMLAGEQHHAVGTMIEGASREPSRMRLTMEDRLETSRAPAQDLAAHVRPVTATVGERKIEGLEWAAAGASADGGNLIAIPDLLQSPQTTIPAVDAGLGLLSTISLERRLGSSSHWSYFFSAAADFIVILPGASLQDLAATATVAPADTAALIRYWLTYDVFQLGRPERNPARAAYWTRVYDDAGGAGRMVSYAAPVYDGGQFRGIVGTDILLSTFDRVLQHMEQPIGLLAIIDDHGEVVGVNGVAFSGDEQQMRAHVASIDIPRRDDVEFSLAGDDWLLVRALAGSPFRLAYIVPASDLQAHLLPRLASYGLILLGLAATFVAILYLLHRAFIGPSIKLATYVADQMAGVAVAVPPVPATWSRHFEAIAVAFSNSRQYRAKLEESEARLLAATTSLVDGFAIFDEHGRLVFHNAAFAGLIGDGGRQGVARHLVEAVGTADAGEAEPFLFRDRWLTGHRHLLPDGSEVVLLRDITAARRAEIELRESEERYRTVVNTQTEFVARYTPEGRTTFVNDAYCRYMGMSNEELLKRAVSDFDLIVPQDRRRHDEHVLSLTLEEPSRAIIFRSYSPHDGSIRWEEWTDTGIFDASGQLVAMQSIGRDITERKLAEEALSASEARMAAFMEHAPVAILAKDKAGRFTMANPETVKRLRHSEAELIGRTTAEILPLAEAAAMDRSVLAVLETGEVQVEEQYHPSLAPYLYSLFIRFPLRGKNGEIDGAGVFVVDQTPHKLAEAELDRQREALHQSEKLAALGSLLAGVAHELNNPLSIVVGYAGMLHELAPDDPTKRRTKEIQVAAERCTRIVKTFLAMARSKPVEKTSVDIETILDDVTELAAYGLRSNGVLVERDRFQPALPAVLADADQLHQVFMNVVLNAQQAMMAVEGERRLLLRTRFEDGSIRIDVEDTGHGIDETVRQRAFEPFFTTKPQGVGTGIGLSVCLGIVKAHGGNMALEPAPGGGTVCRIVLPAGEGAAEAVADEDDSGFSLAGRVLVVDDEPAIARYISETLTAEGVDVVVAPDGEAAQKAILSGEFDAVLTDLRMPGIGGERLIGFIRDNRPALAGRVVVMTGDALSAEVSLGMDGVTIIEKPVDLFALRQALRPFLGKNDNSQASEAP